MKFGLPDTTIENIQTVFEANAKVDEVIVFGSRAKGNYKEGSDIDLAVRDSNISFDDILKLHGQLDDLNLPYKIDLLDYATIKEKALVEHIDRVGIAFYERWKKYKLGDVADIQTGPFGSQLHAHDYVAQGIPTIMPSNIGNRLNIVTDEIMFVNHEDVERLKKYKVKTGDIVYSRRGDVEKCALIKENQNGWLCGTGCLRVRVTSKEFDTNFLAYSLSTPDIKSRIFNSAVGTTMPNLNSSILRELPIIIPPLNEQHKLSSVLSSLDDKINLLQRQNKTLEQLAETLFRQWFVEEANESWELKSLDKVAFYLNGLALQKFPVTGNDYLNVIKIRELKQGISENTDTCSSNIPKQYVVHDGDILFSWSGSLEVVIWYDGDGALNQHLFKVTSDNYPKWFYYLATKSHLKNFKAIAETKSTTMGHIQREHLTQALISIPPDNLFKQYDKSISPLVDKIINNNFQIKQLTQLRDALLPKLMSGEVRVN